MKLLLIQPRFQESFWSFGWVHETLARKAQDNVAPLGLASVAALTPDDWQIRIVDENVETIDFDEEADVVGVGGMSCQYPRQVEILQRFRSKGRFVVVGGSHASLVPEDFSGLVDSIVVGEAEHTWPRFCADFAAGRAQPEYRETGDVDLSACPTPRFDLLHTDRYLHAALQFSRGCPFRCEFCDIIVMFGRKPRTKPLAQVRSELDALRQQGVRNVFFVDDNLIGHRPHCKRLLRFLIEYQEEHDYRFHFGTEASIDLAKDEELVRLFRRANFGWIFFGIESPDEGSLRETRKDQNVGLDLLAAVRRIHAAGITVQAGFIVGFDADGPDIFERQYRFIQEAGITLPMAGLLVAIPRTPLWDRLLEEGRLHPEAIEQGAVLSGSAADNTAPRTNIEPQGMTYEELVLGYVALMRRLFSDAAIAERIDNKLMAIRGPIRGRALPAGLVGFLSRFVLHGVLAGGPRRWWLFSRSLWRAGRRLPRVETVFDAWITSLALRNFIDRKFTEEAVQVALAERRAQEQRYAAGQPELQVQPASEPWRGAVSGAPSSTPAVTAAVE